MKCKKPHPMHGSKSGRVLYFTSNKAKGLRGERREVQETPPDARQQIGQGPVLHVQ